MENKYDITVSKIKPRAVVTLSAKGTERNDFKGNVITLAKDKGDPTVIISTSIGMSLTIGNLEDFITMLRTANELADMELENG